MTTVLIVEDDERLRIALRGTFRARHYDVVEAPTGEAGLLALAQQACDVVVLDLKLPGMDGIETLGELRRVWTIPVIVLTVRYELDDKLAAFAAGADDYVVKPFESEELVARVEAQVRRAPATPAPLTTFRAGDVEIDLDTRSVTRAGEAVHLTRLEYGLLELLATNPGRLLTHAEIVDAVWSGRRSDGTTRLRATVLSLRRKLGEDVDEPRLIFTEPGLGYRWIGAQDIAPDGPLR